MKKNRLFTIALAASMAFAASATDLKDARVYINPGHGGFGPNDRPMATINYAVSDTLGFFETNTDLIKALSLKDELDKAGVGYIRMSRTKNGVVAENDQYATEFDLYRETASGESGVQQLVTLSVISADVEANNMDYFISIHSNASSSNSTNYTVLLYRGTDDASGNGLTNARDMAKLAFPYVNKNGVTYKSHYTSETASNVRGDISFYGSSSTNSRGYTGYLGVLKHGCDGFLSEGCFHTYGPERQRLLNRDYCKQEGVRYSRAIRAWFGDNSETKGCIMGSVKDKYKTLEHDLYQYKINSIDAYYPLNNVTVVLQDESGKQVGSYTTDKEYNGIYVFTDLTPGKYTLVYDIEGYWKETEEIEVVANETAYINKNLTDTDHDQPTEEVNDEVIDYPHPEQDGDIAGADSYNFQKVVQLDKVEALDGLTVRRAIIHDGKYYVLAIASDNSPKMLVLNPETGDLIKEMSTEGIETEGYNGKALKQIISDFGFTTDGSIVATNSTVIGRPNNGYQTGAFYVYIWTPAEGGVVEDATPTKIYTLPTNTYDSLAAAGNNYSNYIANSVAVSGSSDDFNIYFDSHAGDSWTTTYGYMLMCWNFKNKAFAGYQKNNTDFDENQIGEEARISISPLEKSRLIVDGTISVPTEFFFDWSTNQSNVVEKLSAETTAPYGGTYFRYADRIYLSTPTFSTNDEGSAYGVRLYDVTDGLSKAKVVGETEQITLAETTAVPMTSTAVVNNADIDLYLIAGTKLAKFSTAGIDQPASPARIFAYDLSSTMDGDNYTIKFKLNENATNVDLVITDKESGETLKTVSLGALNKGENETSIAKADLPADTQTWGIKASAGSVTRFTKISDDSEQYQYYAPYGVAIDHNPESDFFGRIYVTNSVGGTVSAGSPANPRTSTVGVYVLDAGFNDVTAQGSTAYNGGISWAGTSVSPRKAAVASDGRIFIADGSSTNSGIYIMNPESFEATAMFEGATRDTANGKLTVGGTYVGGQTIAVGVRGEGESTQVYAVDASASGASWKKFVNVYNIGEANSWTTAPNFSKASSSYVGNGNASIVPVADGYWAAQYRGEGSNTSSNPCMFYFSDALGDVTFNTAEPSIVAKSSQNGALAVNEAENLVALSVNGGVSIFSYKMNEETHTPAVTEKFNSALEGIGNYANDFEFDYAGNLYAVSNSGERLTVWAMPTSDNNCFTPAKSTMILSKADASVATVKAEIARVMPNPTTGVITIKAEANIDKIELFSMTGALVMSQYGVNATTTTLDLTALVNGMYFVKVNGGKALKVIKK